MKCPRCNQKTYVNDTREKGGLTRRQRLCAHCGFSFLTYEVEVRTIAREAPGLMRIILEEDKNDKKD